MPSDKSPVFRKPIIPWYHSKTAYGMTIAVMLLVLLFGLAGISVTREFERYSGYIWVPLVLVILSGAIAVTTLVRLFRRHIAK